MQDSVMRFMPSYDFLSAGKLKLTWNEFNLPNSIKITMKVVKMNSNVISSACGVKKNEVNLVLKEIFY